jgi:hypothetical protein
MHSAASDDELRQLVEIVAPHLQAIDAHLDEFDDDEAHLLGSLAEG